MSASLPLLLQRAGDLSPAATWLSQRRRRRPPAFHGSEAFVCAKKGSCDACRYGAVSTRVGEHHGDGLLLQAHRAQRGQARQLLQEFAERGTGEASQTGGFKGHQVDTPNPASAPVSGDSRKHLVGKSPPQARLRHASFRKRLLKRRSLMTSPRQQKDPCCLALQGGNLQGLTVSNDARRSDQEQPSPRNSGTWLACLVERLEANMAAHHGAGGFAPPKWAWRQLFNLRQRLCCLASCVEHVDSKASKGDHMRWPLNRHMCSAREHESDSPRPIASGRPGTAITMTAHLRATSVLSARLWHALG